MSIADLLAEASAPENPAPGWWRESSVQERWPAAEPRTTRATPVPRPIGRTREVTWSQIAMGAALVPTAPERGLGIVFGTPAFTALGW